MSPRPLTICCAVSIASSIWQICTDTSQCSTLIAPSVDVELMVRMLPVLLLRDPFRATVVRSRRSAHHRLAEEPRKSLEVRPNNI
jgi:hypothetical protein